MIGRFPLPYAPRLAPLASRFCSVPIPCSPFPTLTSPWYTEHIACDIFRCPDTDDILRYVLHHDQVTQCQSNPLRMTS